jgi:hypothetical protein
MMDNLKLKFDRLGIVGKRIHLLAMDDVRAPQIGTYVTALMIDGIGDLVVNWDNRCSLNLVPSVVRYRVLKDEDEH